MYRTLANESRKQVIVDRDPDLRRVGAIGLHPRLRLFTYLRALLCRRARPAVRERRAATPTANTTERA
jgi:hypothetical protein